MEEELPSKMHPSSSAPPFSSYDQEDNGGVISPVTGIPAVRNDFVSNNPPNPNHLSPVPWSTGLCDCCDDCRSCCLTCWCPCITFGRISEIVDHGSSSCGVNGALYTMIMCLTGSSCLYSCFYRSKLRGQYILRETPCCDCCVHSCCETCALCQEYRELQNRGFDMSIGWHGNMERQRSAAAVAPPAIQGGMIP